MALAFGQRPKIDDLDIAESPGRVRLAFCMIAAMVAALLLLLAASSMLADPDNWWHVRVGIDLLVNRTFPVVDGYSHTFDGQPWIAKEWLGQVLLALAYCAAGWNGVALATVAAIALTVFLTAWHLSETLKPTVALALALFIAVLICPLFDARPVVFTLPIIVVWTARLFDAARDQRPPPLWLLPLLCLWANLHAAFTFAFVIAFFAGLDLFLRVRLANPALLRRWIVFGLLCPLVCLIHPYGVKAILATLTVANGNEAVPLIGEWQPFDAIANPMQEAALLVAYLGLLLAGLRIGWAKALFALLSIHLYLTHVRFMYLPMLLIPLMVAAEAAAQHRMLSASRWALAARDGVERVLARHFSLVLAGMAAVMALGLLNFLAAPISPSSKTSAEAAIAYARTHKLTDGNVLNSYDLGGSLIFHGIRTFIDGRTDQLFLGGFMQRDTEAGKSGGKPILIDELRKYDISWALLVKNDDRIPFFDELSGWRRTYADDDTVIYARDSHAPAATDPMSTFGLHPQAPRLLDTATLRPHLPDAPSLRGPLP